MAIAQPSFVVYEDWFRKAGITYETWRLDSHFEYDLALLPQGKLDMIVAASPNNPTGCYLSHENVEALLQAHPDTIVVLDEAYFEFVAKPYAHLLKRYPQLILVRTFSKALGLAGLRFGYAVGHPMLMAQIRKMRLPFLLNAWTRITVEEVPALGRSGENNCATRPSDFRRAVKIAAESR